MNVVVLLVMVGLVLTVGVLQYMFGASQGYQLGVEEGRRQREAAR